MFADQGTLEPVLHYGSDAARRLMEREGEARQSKARRKGGGEWKGTLSL